MSGGSVDNHKCFDDAEEKIFLPLYHNSSIVQQPVKLEELARLYASEATSFMERNIRNQKPFFLYMAFSHVHQLCAPKDTPEQQTCQWAAKENATFFDAVEEMDWISGQILDSLDLTGSTNNTFVLFTSDNGPWVAEQVCSGSRGPFLSEWFEKHVDKGCTACPHAFVPQPSEKRPRRCVLPGTEFEIDGVHCGKDTGLGSVWESNLRMPALARYPPKILPQSKSGAPVSRAFCPPLL